MIISKVNNRTGEIKYFDDSVDKLGFDAVIREVASHYQRMGSAVIRDLRGSDKVVPQAFTVGGKHESFSVTMVEFVPPARPVQTAPTAPDTKTEAPATQPESHPETKAEAPVHQPAPSNGNNSSSVPNEPHKVQPISKPQPVAGSESRKKS